MKTERPYVLTLAGFDPSAGAGLLADIKTFEQLHCYGLAVQTANTIQTDDTFTACHWIAKDIIIEQLSIVLKRFPVAYIKVGIVESWSVLEELIGVMKTIKPEAKIVFDPIFSASANFDFHSEASIQTEKLALENVLSHCYLITPNYNELQIMANGIATEDFLKMLSTTTNVLVKGGHKKIEKGIDQLYTTIGTVYEIKGIPELLSAKHGTGCILSAALIAELAKGKSLLEASKKAKNYVEQRMGSNTTLLAYHTSYENKNRLKYI
ncbi:hydroxymethylpyrimidine/phosphomethylpyrimidine kinase [Flavobacterium sp. ASW18X]|uniref:hydroxymethylpyrimidine/phosphomethylpyrimidine kinase n=1 Tax=Flavobacterium sp. ASW18X TaxID=2572595 RepID=UPI00146E5E51|nr:hydroxymethylpyrimidine/phosphomethylpyrimidine kinase [Flavobacterium sp. ASW18X]